MLCAKVCRKITFFCGALHLNEILDKTFSSKSLNILNILYINPSHSIFSSLSILKFIEMKKCT